MLFLDIRVFLESQFFMARRILTKVIVMTSVIDDIYDVYGTPEELDVFTEAVERFNSYAC